MSEGGSPPEMTPERWHQIRDLLADVIGQPSENRSAYVAKVCDGDSAMQAELESLIAAHQVAEGGAFEKPIFGITSVEASDSHTPHRFRTETILGEFKVGSLTGKTISHYRVLEIIGGGGMGLVYRAEDLKLGRAVALKFLPEELSNDPKALARFEREARVVSALSHPNICPIYEFDEYNGQPFLVMELLHGKTLREHLADGDGAFRLTDPAGLDIAVQVARGLEAAHEQGIIHRDIKPANIFVTEKNTAKILDFGVAKILEVSEAHARAAAAASGDIPAPSAAHPDEQPGALHETLTRAGTKLGTAGYMSPEQIRGESLDARTDIFSFGLVLYEMATGERAFTGETEAILHNAIQYSDPKPMRESNPELPPEVENIISKALEKDRERRYQSAAEMRAELKARLEKDPEQRLMVPVEAVNREPSPASTRISQKSTKVGLNWPRQALVVGGVSAFVLILVGALYVSSRDRQMGRTADPQIRSIAVLPLQNLSGDPGQEYFSDGMTDALIADLAQIGSLKVISRTSSMQYKQTSKSLPEIGQELKVDGIVEGSIQRSGDRVRITAQLIHSPSDRHLWANTYEGDFRDIFALERNVTKDITRQVQARIMPQSQIPPMQPRTTNPKALDAYLQGNFYLHRYTYGFGPEEMKKAAEFFQQAIDADPKFAPAYYGLAQAHDHLPLVSPEDAAITRKAEETALALDPNSPDALITLAYIKWGDFDWYGAEKEFRRGVMLNPNNVPVHDNFCELLAEMGRLDEALKECQIAQELDPDNDHLSGVLYRRGEYNDAISILRMMTTRHPDDGGLHYTFFECYVQKQNGKEAIEELERTLVLYGLSNSATRIHAVFATLGFRSAMVQWTKEMENLQTNKEFYLPVNLADAYAVLGDNDHAVYWLGQAVEHRGMIAQGEPATWLGSDPMLASLRSDPRFKDLVRRIGLPQ